MFTSSLSFEGLSPANALGASLGRGLVTLSASATTGVGSKFFGDRCGVGHFGVCFAFGHGRSSELLLVFFVFVVG